MTTDNAFSPPPGKTGPATLLFCLTLASINSVFADSEDTDTAITGTDNNDVISVGDPTSAVAGVISGSAETAKATATVVDANDGNDTVTVDADIDALGLVDMGIIADPGKAKAVATGTGVDAGDGNDIVISGGGVDASADAIGAYAGPLAVDDSIIGAVGKENEVNISIETEATTTGIDGGDGNDSIISSGSVDSLAITAAGGTANQVDVTLTESVTVKSGSSSKSNATGIKSGDGDDSVTTSNTVDAMATSVSGALSVGVVVGDSSDTNRNVKTNMEATASAESTATGIETEDDSTEDSSEDTSPLGIDGLQITYDKTVSTVSGDDTLTVTDDVTATSSAISGSAAASVAVEVSGSSVSTVKSDAKAASTALSTGAGSDNVTNAGALDAGSTALAGAVSFDMEIANPAPAGGGEKKKDKEDKSSSTTNVTAEAKATGIDTEGEGHSKTTSWSAGIADTGIAVDWAINETSIAGDDIVDNRGAINSNAIAGGRADGAAITIGSAGSANSESNSTAKAKSVGIFTGGGNDQVSNIASIDVNSGAAASAVSLGLSAGQSTDTNTENKLGTKSSTKVVAESSAVGIYTEGEASLKTRNGSVAIGADGLSVSVQWGETAAEGDDVVDNSGAITVLAGASADSTDASVTIQATGSVESDSSAKATSEGVAISTGAGSDDITNTGSLSTIATSDASAIALSLTVIEAAEESIDPPPEKKDKSNVKSEASATAEASALGIDAEGDAHSKNMQVMVDITGSGLDVSYQSETTSLSGADTVDNQGNIISVSAATSGAIAAGISIEAEGSVSSKADSKATAKSGGIYTGGGSDAIDNTGDVDASSVATAAALSAGVTVTQPPTDDTDPTKTLLEKLKGKFASTHSTADATAEATSYGIDAEGTDHNKTTSVTTSLSGDGLSIGFSNENLSNSGADTVNNSGNINLLSIATSGAGATEVRVQAGGTASSEANAKATAKTTGINTGGGDDSIDNDGAITADSIASAGAVSISFSQDGPGAESKAEAKATSDSKSVGISADGGNPDKSTTSSLTLNENGIDFSFNHTSTAQSGVDDIANTGAVTAIATSTSAAAGAGITIDGAAEADVTSTAKSSAMGIDVGGDSDTVDSSGGVSAVATSDAGSLAVGFGQKIGEKTKPKVTVKAAATAESEAIGIAADSGKDVTTDIGFSLTENGLSAFFRHETTAASGDDVIDSADAVSAIATSNSGVGAAAVAIDGAASVDVNATAKSAATAFETGGGNDVVTSDGAVTAVATSTAVAVGASVGQKSSDGSKAKVKVDAETTAEASATGISTDGGDANSLIDFSLTIDDSGIAASFEKSSTSASGDDSVTNVGSVASIATATSALTAVSVSIKGAAQAKADTTAKAEAFGMNTGGGADTIDNSGELTAVSTATAATANVTASTEGTAISNTGVLGAGTTATSNAVGITSAGSDYGKSLNVDTAIDFDNFGVTVSVENTNDSLTADGADTILNSGNVIAISTATAPQVTAAVTSKGVAASIGRAKSTSTATAIDSGNLSDVIDNAGDLSSTAISSAYMANVAVTGKGLAVASNSVWDGGTEAEATATGIDADSGSVSITRVDVEVNADRAQVVYESDTQYASGDDQITNTGSIDTLAVALAPGVSVAVAPKGVSAAVSTSNAKAESTSIKGGDGDDDIDNDGSLTSLAEAIATAANVAVTNAGVAAAADAVWDGGTTAKATAIGIAGDGGDRSKNTRLAIGTDEVSFNSTTEIASGTDTINNTGNIVADANAVALSAGVAVAVKGVGVATSTATAEAEATAIDAGAGEEVDDVYNSGDLTASARAEAAAASVAITNTGLAISADSVWEGGTGADAKSRGIYLGEGGESLTNDGNITTDALAITGSVAFSVAVNGVAGATATSTANADSTAIDASEGDDADTIINNGTLTVDAHSVAASASVAVTNAGLTIAADAVWDGGTGAESRARGINVGQGVDTVQNTGDITTNTSASAGSLSVAVTNSGVAVATATSTAEADSVAIDAGEEADDDTIENSGDLTAFADANAISSSISVVNAGLAVAADAVWDGGTGAEAMARGIAAGEGADLIQNSGRIDTDSIAITGSLGVSVAVTGVAAAVATATGDSRATAIDAGDGDYADTVINSGNLEADAIALAATVTASVTTAGVAVAADAVWDGGTGADAHARGIDVSRGADFVDNSGDIDTLASASTASVAVSVAISGVAGATARATGTSTATAIDTGEGDDDDEVINSGDLNAFSNSNAAAAAVTVTTAGVAGSGGAVWDGGTTSDSRARGIDVGAGGDTITNMGNMDIDALSASLEASVSVAVAGVGVSVSTSTGLADASAIDASQGDDTDTVVNTGDLDVDADAFAATATVAVTPGGLAIATDSIWDGGTTAESRARGIETGFGADMIDNAGNVDVTAISGTGSVAVSVPAGAGVGIAVAVATSEADATGLDAGNDDSDDVVLNSGDLDVDADSIAASAAVAFTVAGVTGAGGTPWDGGTTANAAARGITAGDGNDMVISSGTIDADSLATATGVSVAVSVEGVAGAITAANANAQSVGIDTAAGDDVIGSSNTISTSSIANANTLGFAGSKFGMSVAGNNVWDGGTTAVASTTGINAGTGADLIDNDGAINSSASAIAPSATVTFNVIGVAAAISTATAEADATAIDGGDGDDQIDNSGMLIVDTDAVAVTVNAAITGIGVSAAVNSFDGGTTGIASSSGITSGQGSDLIINSGDMDIDAAVVAPAITVTLTGVGAALASSTATADVDASGIDGGDDDDRIDNSGNLDVTSNSTAIAVNAAVTGAGVSGASDAVWDGGTTANSIATGLRGGSGSDVISSAEGVVNNTTANAEADSISVSISGEGYAVSLTASTANAVSDAIDAGSGDDMVFNQSDISSVADAKSTSVSVSVVGTGAAVAGTPNWDGGTTANADADGIALGAGNDEATNSGDVTAMATATAFSAAVSASLVPLPVGGLAVSDAISTADSVSAAMAGESGADILVNEGSLTSESTAVAHGLNVAFTFIGASGAGASAILNNGTNSGALATGMTGGDGIDGIRNAENAAVTIDANASTSDNTVSLALLGISAAASNANALAQGIGLDGGADDDTLVNDGDISATATANAVLRSLSFGSFAGVADASSTGHAVSYGMTGGDGDDWVENSGDIDLSSVSTAIGQSLAGSLIGVSFSAANADAISHATGMAGAAGADMLLNTGSVNVDSDAITRARSLTASQTGFSLSQANTNSTVSSIGMRGGDGDDTIINETGGSVDVGSLARTSSLNAAITIFGAADGQARTLPRAMAIGLAGDAGDDAILNAGDLRVRSRSVSLATGAGASAAGFASANTGTEVETTAVGVSGGSGLDMLINTGSIRVGPAEGATDDARWMSLLDSNGFSAGAIGAAVTESVSSSRTTSIGIDGGNDDDVLSNDGDITVIANALSRSTNSTLNIFGAAGSSSQSGAITMATGLNGGAGDDFIESLQSLDVSAESSLTRSGVGGISFTLAGTNESDSGLVARTTAIGVDGGSGIDTVLTSGSITVNALSSLSSSGGTTTIAGTSSAAGSSGATTYAAGIDGGAGDDVIDNGTDLDIDATSVLRLNGTSYSFGGASDAGGSLTASTAVDGILGGSGADSIRNVGNIDIDARSDLSSEGGSNTTFGASAASSDSGARTRAQGISGGDDDDVIENSTDGTMDVSAVADLSTNAVSYSFVGDPDSNIAMTGTATSVGLQGGAGNNSVSNFGQLAVSAGTSLVATGGSNTTITGFGGGTSGGHTRSTSVALGIGAADGDDLLQTAGSLTVNAMAQSETRNSANTDASLVSNTGAEAAATAVASATGLSGGDGSNIMLTSGDVTVRSDSNAHSLAYANGASVSLSGSARSIVESNSSATAQGVEAGDGDNLVVNDGLLDVTADADTSKTFTITAPVQTFDGEADPQDAEPVPTDLDTIDADLLPELADDSDVQNEDIVFWTRFEPDADETRDPPPRDDPNVGPNGAYYRAVRTANFDDEGNEIEPTWQWIPLPVFIVEKTTERANFPSSAAAVGQGLNGSGVAVAAGNSTATAYGIRLGDGNNSIENHGNVFVTADANAFLKTFAAGGTTGNAAATTTASATARAFGVKLGDGNNVLLNTGTIDVEALAFANAATDAGAGSGVCIDFLFWTWCIAPGNQSESPTASRFAEAVGIETGDGNNTIINETGAEITVRAERAGTGTTTLSAVGIRTGAGDDIVINNGLVSATTVLSGVITAGIGIDTGDGDDQLVLADGSEVIGTVNLGGGDDLLTLIGAPLVHDGSLNPFDLPGGSGIDTLVLQGPGAYLGTPISFEHALKIDDGTFTLPSLATLDSLAIQGGILELNDSYTFATDGSFSTYIHSEGDRGQLLVNGSVIADGAIDVEKRGDTFISDGSRYSVVDATTGVSNGFGDITLPDAHPLLSFELEQTVNSIDIVAVVPSFGTVAGNPLYKLIADNLYSVSALASGDLKVQLGSLQEMDSGFDRAFASLSPDSYQALTSNTISTGHQATQLLRTHLGNARAVRRGSKAGSAAYEPVLLAYAGGELRTDNAVLQPLLMGHSAPLRDDDLALLAANGAPGGAFAGALRPAAQTWLMAVSASGDYELTDGYTEYDHSAGGFALGADYLFGGNSIAGFTVAYADTSIDLTQVVAKADIESWSGGLYATRFSDRAYLEGGISYANQSFVNQRTLMIGSEVRTATSDHNGDTWMAFFGGGREIDFGRWQMEPYATLYYFDISEDGFQETGANSLNQIIGPKSNKALLGEIGTTVVRLQDVPNGVIDWHASLAYNHDFEIDDGTIIYAYEGLPGSVFTIDDRNITAGSAVFGAGLAYIRQRSTLSFDYRGQFNSQYRNHIIGARLSYAF